MSELLDKQKQTQAIKPPNQYQCVLINDDYSTFEFVVEVLMAFFAKTEQQATIITNQIHHQGRGVCGVFSKDIAESKCYQVIRYAQRKEHPLQCIVEPISK